MSPSATSTILTEAEQHLAREVAQVELLGEIAIGEERLAPLCHALASFGLKEAGHRWPHCFAVCLVGVARFRYDGDTFWPHVRGAFGLHDLQAADQGQLGRWFEHYLAARRLPSFSHLVEQGALRYLTPILAHALVPRALVPAFMESVIWRSVEDPDDVGATGEEVQQRMARHAPNIPRPLQRFVVHGGRVARDVIDRSIVVATAAATGEDVDPGLPDWLRGAIREWVEGRANVARARAGRLRRSARRPPTLRFDPVYVRVQLDLPYNEDPEATWEVHLPGGQIHREPWKAAWQRTAATAAVTIDRPFVALSVVLGGPQGVLRAWSLDGLTTGRPGLFFDAASLRAVGSSGYLTGTGWYVVTTADAVLTADGEPLDPREELGEPLGAWTGLVVQYYKAPGAKELRLHAGGYSCTYRLVVERPDARIEAPALPPFLASHSDGVLAFESELPTVVLPAAPDGADERAYLSRWSVHLTSHSGAAGERREVTELAPERLADGTFRLRLEELVPGPDIGDWDLDVAGPLGRGLNTGLSLLPDMEFDVTERPGVAGPELRPSRVFVQTRDGIRVLEDGDAATPAVGGWMLHDRNRNGRIPFTVEDTRTRREATAMITLGTVQWRWLDPGAPAFEPNAAERFSLDAMRPGSAPRLLASNPGDASLLLRLVNPAGRSLQTEFGRQPPGRGATFELAPFLTTAQKAPASSLSLRLELVDYAGQLLGDATVAHLARDIAPKDVAVELGAAVTVIRWDQSRSFPGAVARIASLSRPWDPPIETTIEEQGGHHWARVGAPPLIPGRYELRLWFDDGWVGLAALGPAVEISTGSPAEIAERIVRLPPTAEGRLEGALLREGTGRRRALRELGAVMGPYQLAELVGVVALALERGSAAELLSLPWEEAAAWVAALQTDPLPLLDAIAVHADAPGLRRFCAAIGLDRWPALLRADIPATLRPGLWGSWLPLGAFADLRSARTDAAAALRCKDALGWSPERHSECAACVNGVWPGLPCGATSGPKSSPPNPGQIAAGPQFVPTEAKVTAMRALLSPLPGTPFDPDGWIVASLTALEGLSAGDLPTLERERDVLIADYRRCLAAGEALVLALLPRNGLDQRMAHHRQYPWTFAARMSLAVALMRRLMARRPLDLDTEATAVLDGLAAWLQLRLAPIYERDLCFAEITCCMEFDWT